MSFIPGWYGTDALVTTVLICDGVGVGAGVLSYGSTQARGGLFCGLFGTVVMCVQRLEC